MQHYLVAPNRRALSGRRGFANVVGVKRTTGLGSVWVSVVLATVRRVGYLPATVKFRRK